MKPLLLVLVTCSLCYADQPTPQQSSQQPSSSVKKDADVDYGPLILKNFLSIIPGLLAAAVGHQDGNPELQAAGRTQVVEGVSGFLGALQLLATRKPKAFEQFLTALEDEELFASYLHEELASEECASSLRLWKKSLKAIHQEQVIEINIHTEQA